MNNKLLAICTLTALLLPSATIAQNADNPPLQPGQPARQQIRQELQNMTPQDRQARLRDLRAQGVLAPAGQGQGQGAVQPAGPGGIGAVLNVLTPEQRQSFMEASRSNQQTVRELEDKLREARKAALEATVAAKLDETDLRKKLEAAAKLEAEVTVLRARTLAKMEPPLSAEQIQQIKNSPAAGGMPQRMQGQRPGMGADNMQRDRLPYGNQPLPPPDNMPTLGPRDGNDMPVVR